MEDYYELKWTFAPVDYFEQDLDLDVNGVTIAVRAGWAEARIDPARYEQDADLQEDLYEHLFQAFRGAQLVALKPFELSRPSKTRVHADGKPEIYAEVGIAVEVDHALRVDSVVQKADGTVIDSKADRLAEKRELAERVPQYASDEHLTAMLDSITRGLTDKANCLVHLYEILDSLMSKFDGKNRKNRKNQAISALSLCKSDWNKLGQLANKEPLQEGRHRGQRVGSLRPATEDELGRCRRIASQFIVKYLEYLKDQT